MFTITRTIFILHTVFNSVSFVDGKSIVMKRGTGLKKYSL